MTKRVGAVIVPGKARDAENGFSLLKSRNTAWRNHSTNPEGSTQQATIRRYSSFI